MVEFTFVALLLLLLVFGLIDFGRAILIKQILAGVTREAANLASRGTSLTNTLNAITVSASPLNLPANGYVILTEVFRDSSGQAIITNQLRSGGQPTSSQVGPSVGSPATLPSVTPVIPQPGRSLYVAEVFYAFRPVTPVGQLLGRALPSRLGDVAYF